jgi:hypothetical protein
MGPGRLDSFPPRIWTVSIQFRLGTAAAECRTCGPLRNGTAAHRSARVTALRHLAWHARRDLTPVPVRPTRLPVAPAGPWLFRARPAGTGPGDRLPPVAVDRSVPPVLRGHTAYRRRPPTLAPHHRHGGHQLGQHGR